jgi:hypothetical protein
MMGIISLLVNDLVFIQLKSNCLFQGPQSSGTLGTHGFRLPSSYDRQLQGNPT